MPIIFATLRAFSGESVEKNKICMILRNRVHVEPASAAVLKLTYPAPYGLRTKMRAIESTNLMIQSARSMAQSFKARRARC